jgi:glycosyltransferase involved in cell wall biosynthesis
MPKVSIIIPNYNHARYLRQRIQSVLDQTFQDFDLTYLDDSSSDDSNAVFAEFDGQHRIKAIYNDRNSGSPFKQWNRGIRSTKGEYIWIAESDDVADPNLLATLVPLLEKNAQVGLAYCQSCQIDSNNAIVAQTMHSWTEDLSPDRWSHDFVASGLDECKKYLLFKNTIPNASAVLIRRSVYETIGGAEESMFLCGDWMTWIRMLLKSDIAFSARTLNSFRTHQSSVRSRSVLNGTDIYERTLILQNLQNNVQIPAQTLARYKEDLISNWINLTFDSENTINLQSHINFYQLAKKTISYPESIILKQFAHQMRHRFIRKIRRLLSESLVKSQFQSK